MQGINSKQGYLNRSPQARSIEQNLTNPQSAAVATNTQSPPPVAAAAPLAPPTTQATSAAGEEAAAVVGVKKPKGDDQGHTDIFGILPQDAVIHMCPFLDIDSLVNFAKTSIKPRDCVQEADKFAEKHA